MYSKPFDGSIWTPSRYSNVDAIFDDTDDIIFSLFKYQNFCKILVRFRSDLAIVGSFSGQVWVRFESDLGHIRVRFGTGFGQVWVKFGSGSGQVWARFEAVFGQS